MHDHFALKQFNDAWEKLMNIGVPSQQAHDLLTDVRSARLDSDCEVEHRDVFIDGVKVAVAFAWSDGVIELRKPGEHYCTLGPVL